MSRAKVLLLCANAAVLAWLVLVVMTPPEVARQLLPRRGYVPVRMLGHFIGAPLGVRSDWVLLGDSRLSLLDASAWPASLGPPVNLALAGSTAQRWRELLAEGLPLLSPNAHAVIWFGINDLQNLNRAPEAVARDVRAIAESLAPHVRAVSVLEQIPVSRPELTPQRNAALAREIERFNALLASAPFASARIQRVALFERFADAAGRPLAALYEDGLHLSARGHAQLVRQLTSHQ